jgi:hypothetical protein
MPTITFTDENSQWQLLQPWGPFIGKFKLPENLINDLNKDCDDTAEDEERSRILDWSDKLVGKVRQEFLINPANLEKYNSFFSDCVKKYIEALAQTDGDLIPIDTSGRLELGYQSAWYVRQFAGDYNPPHMHTNGHLSSVGYLKVPDWDEELQIDSEDHAPCHGKILFMHNGVSSWGKSVHLEMPQVGDFYIFPIDLIHQVFPFKSDGERRSFSMNMALEQKLPPGAMMVVE